MEWQTPAVILAVSLAVVYVARRAVRAWAGKAGGCGSCKCAPSKERATTSLVPPEQVTLRVRQR
jgi:hypothetical protein